MTIVLDKYDYHMIQDLVKQDLTKSDSVNDLTAKQIAELVQNKSLEHDFVCAISLSNLYYLVGIYRIWLERENTMSVQLRDDNIETGFLALRILIPDISYRELLSFADLRGVQIEYTTFAEFTNSIEEEATTESDSNDESGDGEEEKDKDIENTIEAGDNKSKSSTTSAPNSEQNETISEKGVKDEQK